MGLSEVKKELSGMEKSEVIKLISEMYVKIPSVQAYLDIFTTGKIHHLVEKYKTQIERYIYPSGSNLVLREKEARKLIRDIRKMKITELNIELELHYVHCCLEIIEEFGYWDEDYCIALEKMFYAAIGGITELGMENKYEKLLDQLSTRASEFGIDVEY